MVLLLAWPRSCGRRLRSLICWLLQIESRSLLSDRNPRGDRLVHVKGGRLAYDPAQPARLSNTRVEQWIRYFDRLSRALLGRSTNTHHSFSEQIQAAHSTCRCGLMWLPGKINMMGGGTPSVRSRRAHSIWPRIPPFRWSRRLFLPRRSESQRVGSPWCSGRRRGRFVNLSKHQPTLELSKWLEVVQSKAAVAFLGKCLRQSHSFRLVSGGRRTHFGRHRVDANPVHSLGSVGRRLPTANRGEDVVFVVAPEDTAFICRPAVPFSVCTTLLRTFTIAVGTRRYAERVVGRFGQLVLFCSSC